MLLITVFYAMLLFMLFYSIFTKNYAAVLIGFFMAFIFMLIKDIPGLGIVTINDLEDKSIYQHYLISLLLPLGMLLVFFLTIILEHSIKHNIHEKKENMEEKRKHIISEREKEYIMKTKKDTEINKFFNKGLDCESELLLIEKITQKEEWVGDIEWIDSSEENNIFESTYLIKDSNLICSILFYNKKILIQYHFNS